MRIPPFLTLNNLKPYNFSPYFLLPTLLHFRYRCAISNFRLMGMGGIFTSSCSRVRAAVRISLSLFGGGGKLSGHIVCNWQNRTGNCNSRDKSLAEIF